MALTTSQNAALRAAILADPVLSQIPIGGDGDITIAEAFNQPSSPQVMVWRNDAPVQAIFDTFNWGAFTPTDTMPESNVDQASIQRYVARLLAIQTKQMNLQLMLQGKETVDATLANFRSGLRDALIAVPSGVNGAGVVVAGASAANALTACTRRATRAEALFVSGPAQTGSVTASLMTFIGELTPADVNTARAN